MPKKTAYSRSGAQRNKTKQKSFELVRPVSDDNVLETVDTEESEEVVEEVASQGEEETVVEEVKVKARSSGVSIKENAPAALVVASEVSEAAGGSSAGSPKSAAARLAARRQAAQKTQRPTANLITADHYSYVRKDLMFILILAIIMFGTIITLHFVLGG